MFKHSSNNYSEQIIFNHTELGMHIDELFNQMSKAHKLDRKVFIENDSPMAQWYDYIDTAYHESTKTVVEPNKQIIYDYLQKAYDFYVYKMCYSDVPSDDTIHHLTQSDIDVWDYCISIDHTPLGSFFTMLYDRLYDAPICCYVVQRCVEVPVLNGIEFYMIPPLDSDILDKGFRKTHNWQYEILDIFE